MSSVPAGPYQDQFCSRTPQIILWDQVSYRKFADDKKLSGGVDMTKGWDAIQTELDKLNKWMHVKLMRFSNAKGKVLDLSEYNPQM